MSSGLRLQTRPLTRTDFRTLKWHVLRLECYASIRPPRLFAVLFAEDSSLPLPHTAAGAILGPSLRMDRS
jgi:hypothetical protein